jgi:hypothetical protein
MSWMPADPAQVARRAILESPGVRWRWFARARPSAQLRRIAVGRRVEVLRSPAPGSTPNKGETYGWIEPTGAVPSTSVTVGCRRFTILASR